MFAFSPAGSALARMITPAVVPEASDPSALIHRADYLGFNNRTCTTSLAPKETAGPVMRQSNKSKQWYDWLVRVEGSGQQDDGSIEVSLQAFIDPKLAEDAYCLGFMSTFYDSPGYSAMCSLPPYGTGMFMNGSVSCPAGQDTDAQKWFIRPVGDSGEIEILAPKPSVCARAVAVKDCEYQPILVNYPVVNEANTNTYAKWKLVKRYDVVPRTSPSPVPSPPAPLGPIPGPIISAPTSTSSGYVNVVVNFLGGNSRCQVTSIEIFALGSPVGSVPKMVKVSASTNTLSTTGTPILLPYAGYNSLYAYSICSTGEKTVVSNRLTVFYLAGGTPAVPQGPTYGVLFLILYKSSGGSPCNAADATQVCDNVIALQSGGTCSMLTESPVFAGGIPVSYNTFAYFAVGTVTYPSQAEALSLVESLGTKPQSLTSGQWGGCGQGFTDVQETLVIPDAVPNPSITPDPPTIDSAAFVNSCNQINVTFTPPADTTGILAYGAKCVPEAGRRKLLVTVYPVYGFGTGTYITLYSYTPGNYICTAWSYTVNSESAVSNAVTANSNVCD